MPNESGPARVTVEELASRVRRDMIPLGSTFSYFAVTPMPEEDIKQYLDDPIAALPPSLGDHLPKIEIILAPFLERNGREKNGRPHCDWIVFEKPPEPKRIYTARVMSKKQATLAFGIKDEDLADYHYSFFGVLASLLARKEGSSEREKYAERLREELAAEVHGEVDDRSWHLKQGLRRRQKNVRQETNAFLDYVTQSFEDTLTLYLHGICCDIDVETGPRQMPSRYLRKRLELLMSMYPPPAGYAVLPEHTKKRT